MEMLEKLRSSLNVSVAQAVPAPGKGASAPDGTVCYDNPQIAAIADCAPQQRISDHRPGDSGNGASFLREGWCRGEWAAVLPQTLFQ